MTKHECNVLARARNRMSEVLGQNSSLFGNGRLRIYNWRRKKSLVMRSFWISTFLALLIPVRLAPGDDLAISIPIQLTR